MTLSPLSNPIRLHRLAAILCAIGFVGYAQAQAVYPTRPLRVIVGFPPGSGTDMIARFVGNKLTERLGQQVVVDNRPGANGIIVAELVAKAAPDGHTLLAMSISHTIGVQLINVPYKGGAQALTDLIGGQVQIMFGTAAITLAQIRAGRMKALGVSAPKRSALLPDVPTLAESGAPGYDMNTWWGVLGPAAMPAAVVSPLNGDIAAILGQPQSAKRLEAEGAAPSPLPSAEFMRMLVIEIEKWTRVARDANIKSD